MSQQSSHPLNLPVTKIFYGILILKEAPGSNLIHSQTSGRSKLILSYSSTNVAKAPPSPYSFAL